VKYITLFAVETCSCRYVFEY